MVGFLKKILVGTALSGPVFMSGAVGAQESGTTVLSPIIVQSSGDDGVGPVKGFVAKTSRSATKTGTPLLETQQSVSVITRDQIDAQNAATLGEVLNYTPGVVGQPFGADPRFDSPVLRGFDGRQSQYLNGLKLMRTSGAPSVETYGLERVDVIRGPSSVMYGQGNPGGIINQVSKRPRLDRFGEVGVQGGSFDTVSGFFDFGSLLPGSDNVAYRVTGLAKSAGAQTRELNNDRFFIAPSFLWEIDGDTSLTLLTSFQKDNPSTPSGLPAQYTLNPTSYRLPRNFYVGDKSFDASDRKMTNLGYEFEQGLNDTWKFRQNVRYTNFDWEYQALGMSSSGLLADGRTLRRTATFQDELLNTFNVDNNLQGDFETGDVQHTMLFGLDYRYFDNDTSTRFYQATPLDLRSPVYGGPISLISPTTDVRVTSQLSQIGLYAQDELAFGNWRASLGLRQDWASSDGVSSNALTGAKPSLDRDDHKLTGRAGISYLFDSGIAPYFSYATSFEPVVTTGVGGTSFKPTTGEQFELGAKFQPEGWDGFFTAAVYDLKQKNVLRTVSPGVSEQIGEVHSRGIELEGVASLAEGVDLRAAYTFTRAIIGEGADNGKRVENVPEHAASLWASYTFAEDTALEGLSLGMGVRYTGQRYGNSQNTFNLSGVALLDAGISYTKNGYKASLNVQNIADKDYVANCSSFGCYYGDGRVVMGRLSYSW